MINPKAMMDEIKFLEESLKTGNEEFHYLEEKYIQLKRQNQTLQTNLADLAKDYKEFRSQNQTLKEKLEVAVKYLNNIAGGENHPWVFEARRGLKEINSQEK